MTLGDLGPYTFAVEICCHGDGNLLQSTKFWETPSWTSSEVLEAAGEIALFEADKL